MSLPRAFALALPLSLAQITLTAPMTQAQDAIDMVGDPDKGRTVYQRVGICVSCHGWAGDGQSGRNWRSPGGANLRETQLDKEGLIEVIKCGIPGSQMPYHDGAAYRDDRCYGLVMSDFDPGGEPVRGKTFRDKDMANLVAYLQTHMIGLGKPNYAECADYFGTSADKACSYLKTE